MRDDLGNYSLQVFSQDDFELVDQFMDHFWKTNPVGTDGVVPWNSAQVRTELEHAQAWALVLDGLQRPKKIVALFFEKKIDSEIVEIRWVGTLFEYRQRGLMKNLIRQYLASILAGHIWLEVHENNVASRNLFESLGFTVQGRRDKYYARGGAAVLYSYDYSLCGPI